MENKLSFPSYHNGSINAIKLNYQGDKIATCGNDCKINIFSLDKIKLYISIYIIYKYIFFIFIFLNKIYLKWKINYHFLVFTMVQ